MPNVAIWIWLFHTRMEQLGWEFIWVISKMMLSRITQEIEITVCFCSSSATTNTFSLLQIVNVRYFRCQEYERHLEHLSNNNNGLYYGLVCQDRWWWTLFYFLFSFSFYFTLLFLFLFSIFRTTRVRVYQSRCHISHKLMA